MSVLRGANLYAFVDELLKRDVFLLVYELFCLCEAFDTFLSSCVETLCCKISVSWTFILLKPASLLTEDCIVKFG